VWEKAHLLVLAVYKATEVFPRQELYSLTSQIQRAAVSIPANIAEGCGKSGDADFSRYLQIAMGSSSQLIETRKMLNALITRLKASR
jgi:four helix bundle protein